MAIKNISLPMLVGAVVIGIAAAFMSVVYLKYKERQLEAALKGPEVANIAVVVASADLAKGAILNGGNLAVREIPADLVHPTAITPDSFDAIEGKLLIQQLAKGRPLLREFVAGGSAKDFSDVISKGRRAVTIQVDELNSIGGHARPGNHIDIYALLPGALKLQGIQGLGSNLAGAAKSALQAAAQGKLVVPVLQDVQVLATGDSTHGEYEEKYSYAALNRVNQQTSYTTVTLNLTPMQASLLAQAVEYGDLLTMLRNRGDRSMADFAEISPASLFSNAKRMKAEAARNKEVKINTDGLKEVAPGVFETADGRVVTANGKELVGMSVNADGQLVTSTGEIVQPDNLVVNADGSVTTADGKAIAGVTAEALTISSNGDVLGSDGKVIAGVSANTKGMKEIAPGIFETADGKVVTADGKELVGMSVNADGKLVTSTGEVIDADNIIVGKDGSVMTADGKEIAGVTTRELINDALNNVFDTVPSTIEFLAGGNSKGGVAIPSVLPVIGIDEQGNDSADEAGSKQEIGQ